MSEERRSPSHRRYNAPPNYLKPAPPPSQTNPGVRKAVTLFGVTDLRQLIDKKHQGCDNNNAKSLLPEDPSFNYLKDPARDQHQQKSSPTRQDGRAFAEKKRIQPKKNLQTKQIINSNRYRVHGSKEENAGNTTTEGEVKVKKELRFDDRAAADALDVVSVRFPNNSRRNKSEDLANIKVQLNMETGQRNCVVDQDTKIPNLEHFPTRKPYNNRGYRGAGRGYVSRGGRGASGNFRGRGRAGNFYHHYDGTTKRHNDSEPTRNLKGRENVESVALPPVNDDNRPVAEQQPDNIELKNDGSVQEKRNTRESQEHYYNHGRKPHNNRQQGWRKSQGGYRNGNSKRQSHNSRQKEAEIEELQPATEAGIIPPDQNWSIDEVETVDSSNNAAVDDVEGYEANYNETNQEAVEEFEEEEEYDDDDEHYYTSLAIEQENVEDEGSQNAEKDKHKDDGNNSTNFDESLVETITVVSSKYQEDGAVKRSVTVSSEKELETENKNEENPISDTENKENA